MMHSSVLSVMSDGVKIAWIAMLSGIAPTIIGWLINRANQKREERLGGKIDTNTELTKTSAGAAQTAAKAASDSAKVVVQAKDSADKAYAAANGFNEREKKNADMGGRLTAIEKDVGELKVDVGGMKTQVADMHGRMSVALPLLVTGTKSK